MNDGTRADPHAAWKRAAAEAAVDLVQDGMAVGLGTGSTAAYAIDAMARRVRAGLRVRAIPTSERTAQRALAGGIPLVSFAECPELDLTIDGADEIVRGSLDLVKGLGGALLREKIVAASSKRLVIVADSSKLVDRLGTHVPVPVEVVEFGWETTAARLAARGIRPAPRRVGDRQFFRTDSGNMILDCIADPIGDPTPLARELGEVVGVVETGLFIGMAESALVADQEGVRAVRPAGKG
jgi:ribose 5-phosphate isomerase A